MAPEIINADSTPPIMAQLGPQVDVWAAGVMLFTLSTGVLPFMTLEQVKMPESQLHTAIQMHPLFMPLNPLLKDLILRMLRVSPIDRLTSA